MLAPDRFNLYTQIHKALRALMCETLLEVGRADPTDSRDVEQALAAVRTLLDIARGHLHHEDAFIHPALEEARPGSSSETQRDHAHHIESFAALEATARTVERGADAERAQALLRLYRQLALFIAENFEHMHVEETENHAVLADCYSDDELHALEGRLVAAIPPAELMAVLSWMIPSVSAPERAGLLGGLQQTAPAPAFAAVLELARQRLVARDWAKLNAAIGPMPLAACEPLVGTPDRVAA
jgi:hypothetical protein